MKKILVCLGGTSPEREVSLRSGKAICAALERSGYMVEVFDYQTDPITKILDFQPNLAFIALHGAGGEDGKIQGFLEIMNIPYTGSGVLTSALCMNKVTTKKIFAYENIPTPAFKVLKKNELEQEAKAFIKEFKLPFVIKASSQGSSIGVYIVQEEKEIEPAVSNAFLYDEEIIIEEYIKGREVTVVVVGNEEPEVLPLIEVKAAHAFYDYDSKYTVGMSEHIIPAELPDKVTEEIKEISARTYWLLGCKGVSRIDFMLDENLNPLVLEVNTIPGMTETSLVPDAVRAAGWSFDDFVQRMVRLSIGE